MDPLEVASYDNPGHRHGNWKKWLGSIDQFRLGSPPSLLPPLCRKDDDIDDPAICHMSEQTPEVCTHCPKHAGIPSEPLSNETWPTQRCACRDKAGSLPGHVTLCQHAHVSLATAGMSTG